MGIRSYPHGGTHNTSDNFPAQKDRCQDSVKIFTGSTPVRGNQAGISTCLIIPLGLVSTHLILRRQNNPLPPRTIGPRRSKLRHLQFIPILQHGNTLQPEAKTKVTQPIHAGLN